jgi:glycerol-3-phosphate acyltransferase PlsY
VSKEGARMMIFLALCIIAYFVGSVPTGKIIARFKGIDIQSMGTGNIGASNTYLVIGKRAGFLVLLGDMGKAFLMMEISIIFLSIGEALIIGLVLLIGNMKSIFLRFTGGKGIATGLGIIISTEPLAALVLVIFWTIALFFAKYALIIGVLGAMFVPATYFKLDHDALTLACSLIMVIFILLGHRSNLDLKGALKEDVVEEKEVNPSVQKI